MLTKNKVKKGFTLIELLVVISIIAMLLSILMPSLQKAKQQAKAVICATNQKSLGTIWALYANDNEEYFPIGLSWDTWKAWFKDAENGGITDYLPTGTRWGDAADEDAVFKGYYCSANIGKALRVKASEDGSGEGGFGIATGYDFNYHLGFERYAKPVNISQPANVPHLYCYWDNEPLPSQPNANMGNYFGAASDPPLDENGASSIAYRFMAGASNVHGNGTNFLMVDGHVEKSKPLGTQEDYADRFTWEPKGNYYKEEPALRLF